MQSIIEKKSAPLLPGKLPTWGCTLFRSRHDHTVLLY